MGIGDIRWLATVEKDQTAEQLLQAATVALHVSMQRTFSLSHQVGTTLPEKQKPSLGSHML